MTIDSGIFDNMTIKNLVCRFNQCAPDWGETDCCYTYHKFYYIIDGEGEIIIDQDRFGLKPGELYLIPANTVHTYRHNPLCPIIKYWCHFDLTLGEEKYFRYTRETLMCRLPGEKGIPVFQRLIQAANATDPLKSLSVNAALLHLLQLFLTRVDLAAILAVSENDTTQQLKRYIQTHIQEKITIPQLAKVAHLHPNYLIRYFQKNFFDSPIQYVNDLRLERATQQLTQSPAKPIKQIVNDIGFSDYHYFTRLFKRKYGLTPSAYRATDAER